MASPAKGLELVADGTISLDVNYSFTEHDDGVSVHARVGIRRRRGLTAQLLQAAVAALLNAGALARPLRKLERTEPAVANDPGRGQSVPLLAAGFGIDATRDSPGRRQSGVRQ